MIAALLAPMPMLAATIHWTSWTGGTVLPVNGDASGTIAALGVTVSYTGENRGFVDDIWTPQPTWTGGIVDNAPPNDPGNTMDAIELHGALVLPPTATITFSSPVVDPIIAIYSLGNPVSEAVFLFGDEPLSIQGTGGSNTIFGGQGLYLAGDGPVFSLCPAGAVCGNEGNGVVLIPGVYTSITWTNPNFENYYAFTIGARDVIPEPTTALLLAGGLVALAAHRRRS